MIHKYALIAEYEFDDENGEYAPPSSREVERALVNAMYSKVKWLGFKETHFEIARGTLHDAFSVGEAK